MTAYRPQTDPFPPLRQTEHSWEQNLRASLGFLIPGAGARDGLKLSIPATGLEPGLTDGYLLQGDRVIGPYGSQLLSPAPASAARSLYFGLAGPYYATEPATVRDVLLGTLATTADGIIYVAQPINAGSGRVGVRGQVAISRAVDGSDQSMLSLPIPAGFEYARVAYAQSRVIGATTGGTDSGDNFVLKAGPAGSLLTLTTIAHSALPTLGATSRYVPVSADASSWAGATALTVAYNQTDTATAIAGGLVEFAVLFDLF